MLNLESLDIEPVTFRLQSGPEDDVPGLHLSSAVRRGPALRWCQVNFGSVSCDCFWINTPRRA